MLRVLLFVIQIPSRCDVLSQLSQLNASALSLSAILRSNSWLSMQISSLSVTLWIALTMFGTVIAQRCSQTQSQSQSTHYGHDAVYFCVEGELSLCLLRCSYISEEDKNVKVEEEQDATIFAILNRRQFMADESESESGSSWDSS